MPEEEIGADWPHVVCFHLYNDFSGSPIILRTVLRGLLRKGFQITLRTSRGGILDTLSDANLSRSYYYYRFSRRPLVTMVRYAWVQCHSFVYALRYAREKNCVFYINTLLPIGPALAGWLMRKRVVYHYHENAWIKGRVYKMLSWMMRWIASDIICVSDYQRRTLLDNHKVTIVPNAVSDIFMSRAQADAEAAYARQTVMMACSCKRYKGVVEFFRLAERMPRLRFLLVLNETPGQVEEFLQELGARALPNVTVEPSTDDMGSVYARASVVLNLSDKNKVVETFGMTVIEAMCYGLPCIVPMVGGISELVREGVTGYHVDSHDTELLAQRIERLLSDRELYGQMAVAAVADSRNYGESNMVEAIHRLLIKEEK